MVAPTPMPAFAPLHRPRLGDAGDEVVVDDDVELMVLTVLEALEFVD